jgi:Spy/CpxP family protein refolding chaperone
MKIRTLALSALLGATLSASALAQPGQGMGPGGGMGPGMGGMGPGGKGMQYRFNKDNTPGWSLMTPEERTAHHDKMMAAKTYDDCKAAQAEQHKQMEERAKAQGKTLPGPRQNACDNMKARGFYK